MRGPIRSNSRVLRTDSLRGLMRRRAAFAYAGLSPQLGGGFDRIDAGVLPPGCFVADAVDEPVMDAAERDREFVAGLAAKRPRLQMPEVMRVRWLAAADQAGLLGDMAKVLACRGSAAARGPRARSCRFRPASLSGRY